MSMPGLGSRCVPGPDLAEVGGGGGEEAQRQIDRHREVGKGDWGGGRKTEMQSMRGWGEKRDRAIEEDIREGKNKI